MKTLFKCLARFEQNRGIEYDLNGKRADVGVIRPDMKAAFEIVWDDDLQKEVSNLLKDLEVGFDQVTFCVRDEVMREKLETEFSKAVAEWKARASIVLLESFTDKKSK